MLAYLRITTLVFAMLTLGHLWRIVAESPALARDPGFVAITAGAAALGVWGALSTRRLRRTVSVGRRDP